EPSTGRRRGWIQSRAGHWWRERKPAWPPPNDSGLEPTRPNDCFLAGSFATIPRRGAPRSSNPVALFRWPGDWFQYLGSEHGSTPRFWGRFKQAMVGVNRPGFDGGSGVSWLGQSRVIGNHAAVVG